MTFSLYVPPGNKIYLSKIQIHKRFKRTLFIRTKEDMQIFGVIAFIKLQNDSD